MPRYVTACWMFCYEKGRPHDFDVRLGKGQRYHGCVEGKSYAAKMAMAKRDLAAEKKKADMTRRAKISKQVKIKGNRKLCPVCGEVWTVNVYLCVHCQRRYGDNYDIDGIVAFQSGSARHVNHRGSIWAMS